jgi:hypothetical protein
MGDPAVRTYAEFSARVKELLEPTAQSKGYNTTGVDGQNQLYEFVQDTVGGPGHAIGEAIYKVKRYAAKRNPEDLEKLAAWAFLIWKHHVPKSGAVVPDLGTQQRHGDEPI